MVINEKIADIKKCLEVMIDADFVWAIDKLSERPNATSIDSEYFKVREEQYKMRLSCGWRQNYGKDVHVYLNIYPDENDADLPWPFERRVTMTITNRHSPNVHRTVTKQCRIARPPYNLFYKYQWSAAFTFLHCDLAHAGLLKNDNMIVNCFIDNQ